MNRWAENGCSPYGSEKDENGNQVFESKWCDGAVPMKSLCIADRGDHSSDAHAHGGTGAVHPRHYCGHGTVYDDRKHLCVVSYHDFIDRCRHEPHLGMCGHHRNDDTSCATASDPA